MYQYYDVNDNTKYLEEEVRSFPISWYLRVSNSASGSACGREYFTDIRDCEYIYVCI